MKNIRVFIIGLVSGLMLMASTSVFASTQEINALITNFIFKINGQEVQFESQPIVYDGRSYLPVRFVEELGFEVDFDNSTKTVEFSNDEFEYVPSNNPVARSVAEVGDDEIQTQDQILVDGLSTMFLNSEGKLDLGQIQEAVENGEIHVNSQDSKTGDTLTVLGAKHGNYFVVEYMHSKGADLDLADFEGKTPLHHAVIGEELSIIGNLVNSFDARPNLPDSDGKKPIDYVESEFSSIYTFLRSKK